MYLIYIYILGFYYSIKAHHTLNKTDQGGLRTTLLVCEGVSFDCWCKKPQAQVQVKMKIQETHKLMEGF